MNTRKKTDLKFPTRLLPGEKAVLEEWTHMCKAFAEYITVLSPNCPHCNAFRTQYFLDKKKP